MELSYRSIVLGALAGLISIAAHASGQIGLMTYAGRGLSGQLTFAGHSAIYFSSICPDGPLKLRKCGAGEEGSVIARYSDWGETPDGVRGQNDWALVPLVAHLYGVESREKIPVIYTEEITRAIREDYRKNHFPNLVRDPRPGEIETPGEWRHMLAVSQSRGVDNIVLEISDEEESKLIDTFNSAPNERKFNFYYSNCADFSRQVLSEVFDDFGKKWGFKGIFRAIKNMGMTAPLTVEKDQTAYGRKHPERLMRFEVIQQAPGTAVFDSPTRDGMENAIKQPLYTIPLAIFTPHWLIRVGLLSLFDTYNNVKERKKHPNLEVAQLYNEIEMLQGRFGLARNQAEVEEVQLEIVRKKNELLVALAAWDKRFDDGFDGYRQRFSKLIDSALAAGAIEGRQAWLLKNAKPQAYLKLFEGPAVNVAVDSKRGLLLTKTFDGTTRTAGAAFDNIEKEDPRLGFELILGTLNYMLDVKKVDRVTLEDLHRAWNTMMHLAARVGVSVQ